MKGLNAIFAIILIAIVLILGNLAVLFVFDINVTGKMQQSFSEVTGSMIKAMKSISISSQQPQEQQKIEQNDYEQQKQSQDYEETYNDAETYNDEESQSQDEQAQDDEESKTSTTIKKQAGEFFIDIDNDGDLDDFGSCDEALNFAHILVDTNKNKKTQIEEDIDDYKDTIDRYNDLILETTNSDKKEDYQDSLDDAETKKENLEDDLEKVERNLEWAEDILSNVIKKCQYMS